MIRNSALSPTGVRAAFEARGEIFTVPAEKGDYRNLTQSTGAHDRSPVWSPDGAQLAWLSDASGEYQLMLGDPLGVSTPRAIPFPSTAFFSAPSWSPDGTQILLQDNHRNLWTIEVTSGKAAKIDTITIPIQFANSMPNGRRILSGWPIPRVCRATCARSSFIRWLIKRRIR